MRSFSLADPRAQSLRSLVPRGGRPVPEEFPPYKLQIQSAPRYIERMPNVPWQNIGPTYTCVHVSAPATDARERTAVALLLCMYLYRVYTLKTHERAHSYARHSVPWNPHRLFDRTVDEAALCEVDWQRQTFAIAVADFGQHIRSLYQRYPSQRQPEIDRRCRGGSAPQRNQLWITKV